MWRAVQLCLLYVCSLLNGVMPEHNETSLSFSLEGHEFIVKTSTKHGEMLVLRSDRYVDHMIMSTSKSN